MAIEKVRREEVKLALHEMKSRKAPRPSGVTSDLLKVAGEETLKELSCIMSKLLDGDNMPDDWKNKIIVPLFKGKCNKVC